MSKLLISLLGCCLTLAGQPGLRVPSAGLLRDSRNTLRPVLGIEANFILGEPLVENVRSVACSGDSGLVKTADKILVLDRDGQVISTRAAAAGEALFAFTTAGAPLAAYLPASGKLRLWWRGRWRLIDPAPLPAGDRLVALGPARHGRLAMVSLRDGVYWLTEVSRWSGRVLLQKVEPGISEPVLLPDAGVLLYSTDDGLVLRRAGGDERRIPLPVRPEALERMGKEWVHIISVSSSFALKLGSGEVPPRLYRLPEATP